MGMAQPTEAARSLLGSLLVSLLMTQNTIWPGESFLSPTVLGTIFAAGGNMLETCTRLNFSMPASRRASSNEVSSSLWMPTPFVKKTLLGTNIFSTPGLYNGRLYYRPWSPYRHEISPSALFSSLRQKRRT